MSNFRLYTFGCCLLLLTGMSYAEDSKQQEKKHDAKSWIEITSKARTFDLSHYWDENSPIASVNPPFSMQLNATHSDTRGIFGDGGQLSFTSEKMQWSGQHGAPSIDAIGHIGRDGKLYGGIDAAMATGDARGLGRSGVGSKLAIDHYPENLLANRAVLLDVARYINHDDSPLAAGFDINAQHLMQTAKAQGVRIRKNDTVFIRTGWGRYFNDNPQLYTADEAAGVGVSGAQYLIDKGVSVVGNDTLTFEKRPPLAFEPTFQVFPVHMMLLADNGIYIIENLLLEDLAEARVYEFVAIVPPLKVRGGTGSALRVFALTDSN